MDAKAIGLLVFFVVIFLINLGIYRQSKDKGHFVCVVLTGIYIVADFLMMIFK